MTLHYLKICNNTLLKSFKAGFYQMQWLKIEFLIGYLNRKETMRVFFKHRTTRLS
jgi:hypothetical protein